MPRTHADGHRSYGSLLEDVSEHHVYHASRLGVQCMHRRFDQGGEDHRKLVWQLFYPWQPAIGMYQPSIGKVENTFLQGYAQCFAR
jgi:hypothetical protein